MMKMMTTTTTMTTMTTNEEDDEDNNDGTRRPGETRGADAPPFFFFFFSVSFLFSLLTSYFLFYSYDINDNMPPWQVPMEGPRGTNNRPEVMPPVCTSPPSFGGCSVDYVIKVLD
jgi:hypothetical protein